MKKYYLLALLCLSDFVHAETTSAHTLEGSVTFVSDYRSRGISQTIKRPAIQGSLEYTHKSGFYFNSWASNTDGNSDFYNNTSMEWELSGGCKGFFFPSLSQNFGFDVGFVYYYYPGGVVQNPQNTSYNTVELYIMLSYKLLSIKYFQTVTDYYGINADNPPRNWDTGVEDPANGNSIGSPYIDVNLNIPLYNKVRIGCHQAGKLNLTLHVGYQAIRHYSNLNYIDWLATLDQEFDWFHLFFAYVGTNAKRAYYNIPDNAYKPTRSYLGSQGVLFGVTKTL